MKSIFKQLWFFTKIFSIFALFAFPCIIIYDFIFPWELGEKELERYYPEESHIAIGYSFSSEYNDHRRITNVQRSYILIPKVLKDWSIISVSEINNKKIEIDLVPYAFLLYILFWGVILWIGIYYGFPRVRIFIKNKMGT